MSPSSSCTAPTTYIPTQMSRKPEAMLASLLEASVSLLEASVNLLNISLFYDTFPYNFTYLSFPSVCR